MKVHEASQVVSGCGSSGRLTAAGALAAVVAAGCGAGDLSAPSEVNEAAVTQWHAAFNQAADGAANTVAPAKYGDDASPTNAPAPFKTTANVTCKPIVEGTNSVVVNGKTRRFEVRLPANRATNAALLFEWHGFTQNSADFMNTIVYDPPAGRWKPFDVNAFPIPLITVAPIDENLIPVWGLDWDIVSGEKDFPFFEAMLTCIEAQFKVDTRRVYSFGFSAGAVFTNLLSAAYPRLFAATIAESGAWFNDRKEWGEIIVPGTGTLFMRWKWPAFDGADRGAVLLTHGGPRDFATVISLENANNKAVPFLFDAKRDVTECTHEFGHTLEPDITQAMYYRFLWDHQLGGPRPTALTAGMPTADRPLFNSRCYFYRNP